MSNPFLSKTTSTVDNNLLHRIIKNSSNSPSTFSLPNLNAPSPQAYQPYARNLPTQTNSNASTFNSSNSKLPRTDSITIIESPSKKNEIPQTKSPNKPKSSNKISNTPPKITSDTQPRGLFQVETNVNKTGENKNSKVVTISIKTPKGAIALKMSDKQMFSLTHYHSIGKATIPQGIRTQKSSTSYAKKYDSQLNLGIYLNCLKLKQSMEQNTLRELSHDLQKRLHKGFDFYENSKQANMSMKIILDQNLMMGNNINLCQAIYKMSQDLRMNPLICYYSIIHSNKGVRDLSRQQCDSFILSDRINLVKVYILLNRNGRLSTRRFAKHKDELRVIDTILKYYSQGPFGNRDQWTDLGLSIIQLLTTILIKNSSQISAAQVQDYFSHKVQQLKNVIAQKTPEESAMNELLFNMFLKWPHEMRNVDFKKIKSFIDYYTGPTTNVTAIASIMKELNEIKQYDEPMKNLVRQKTISFLNSQANERSGCMDTAIQAILLIKQSIKSGHLDTVEILIRVLFNQSPCAALQLVLNFLTNHDLILPYLSNSAKNSSDRYLSLESVNSYLIPQFRFKSTCQSFVSLMYIINLMQTYCKADYPNYHIPNWELLDETLDKVKKFTFRFSDVTSQRNQMKIIELVQRYIVAFTNDFQPHRGSVSISRHQMRQVDSIRLQQTLSIAELILKSLTNVMVLFKRLKSRNEKGFTFDKLKANFIKLLNIFTSTKLIFFNANEFSYKDFGNIEITEIYKKLQQKVLQLSDLTENKETAIEVGLKLYKEWQQKLNSGNSVKNHILLLITLQTFNKINISQKQKVSSYILADQLFNQYNLSSIIEHCVTLDGRNVQNDEHKQEMIHLTLSVVEFMLRQSQLYGKQEKQERWRANLQNMVIKHSSFFVHICLKHISSYASQEPHIKVNCPRYLNLMANIFNLSHLKQSKYDHSAKMKNQQMLKSQLFKELQAKDRVDKNEAKKMIESLVWTVYNPTVVDSHITKMKVSLAEIAIKFDECVLNEIINKNYLLNLSSFLINQIEAHLVIRHSKHQQQEDSIIFISQCLTTFYEFFRRQLGFFISQEISSTFLKAISHQICASSPVASDSQIVKWLSMTMRQIKTGIKSNSEFVTILEQSIFYIANHMHQQNWSREIGKYLIQICALQISNGKSLATKLRKKQYILTFCLPFLKVCTAAVEVLTNDPSILLGNPNDQTLIKVGAAVILKASQFINIYYLCQKQLPSGEVCKQANHTVLLMKKILQSIVPNIRKQNQVEIKDTLDLICQMLSLGKQEIKVEYVNYNEALITIATREDSSSRQCFVGLVNEVLNWEKRDNNKKNFRSHYLLYFLMKQIIGSDTKKLAFFQYFNVSNLQHKAIPTLHDQVKDSMKELVYHLLQKNKQTNIVRRTWNMVLLSHVLIMHPVLISTGIFADRIQQACAISLELVNQNTGTQNSMIFWVMFMHTLSISILILTTNKQKNPNFNCMLFQAIRRGIVRKLEDCICKWDLLKCNEDQKIFHIGVSSIDVLENKIDNHSLRENFHKNVLVQPNQQVPSSQEKENSFVGYLNCNMVLIMIYGCLHFYSIDKRKTSISSQKLLRSRITDLSKEVLSNYFSFHQTYFKIGAKQTSPVRAQQNVDLISTMSKAYTTEIDLNMSQNYLNKVVGDFVGFNTVLNIHSLHVTLPELEKNELPSLIWYNFIQDTLTQMGVKASYKLPLAQLHLKSQTSLRNSRRSSASRRK